MNNEQESRAATMPKL